MTCISSCPWMTPILFLYMPLSTLIHLIHIPTDPWSFCFFLSTTINCCRPFLGLYSKAISSDAFHDSFSYLAFLIRVIKILPMYTSSLIGIHLENFPLHYFARFDVRFSLLVLVIQMRMQKYTHFDTSFVFHWGSNNFDVFNTFERPLPQ